jgi:hypothetical protein
MFSWWHTLPTGDAPLWLCVPKHQNNGSMPPYAGPGWPFSDVISSVPYIRSARGATIREDSPVFARGRRSNGGEPETD